MKILETLKTFWVKHDTQILTAVAVTGAIVTPILASRATLKAERVLEEHNNAEERSEAIAEEINENAKEDLSADVDYHHVKTPWYKSPAVWKQLVIIYGPTAVSMGVTVSSIIFCHRIHLDKEASLAAMSAMWERRYRTLENKMEEKVGKEVAEEVKKEALEEEKKVPKRKAKENLLEEFWIEDKITKQKFKTCSNNFIWVNQYVNEEFAKGRRVIWANIICLLGGKKNGLGEDCGYDPANDEFVEFLDYNESGYFGYYWFNIFPDKHIGDGVTAIPCVMSNVEPWEILPFK